MYYAVVGLGRLWYDVVMACETMSTTNDQPMTDQRAGSCTRMHVTAHSLMTMSAYGRMYADIRDLPGVGGREGGDGDEGGDEGV